MENGNKPISPLQDAGFPSYESVVEEGTMIGLTKREHFAAIAMQGILSNNHYTKCVESNIWKPAQGEIGKLAVEMADELLGALEKK